MKLMGVDRSVYEKYTVDICLYTTVMTKSTNKMNNVGDVTLQIMLYFHMISLVIN